MLETMCLKPKYLHKLILLQVYSEAEPSLLGLTPSKAMAQYDSRHRSTAYTIADKNRGLSSGGIVTHSSSWLKGSDKQPVKDENKADTTEVSRKLNARLNSNVKQLGLI